VDIHKFALFAVLSIGAIALIYNAVSIINGEGGLAGLSALADGERLAQRVY
jgi:hypothetical protein